MITRAKSCTGKIRHKDKTGAVVAMRIMGNAQMNSYPCRFCKGWHIGHSNKPNKLQARFDQLIGPDPFIRKSS